MCLLVMAAAVAIAVPATAQTPPNLADLPNSFYAQPMAAGSAEEPFEPEKEISRAALTNPESLAGILGEQVYVQPKDALSVPVQPIVLKGLADVLKMSIEARRYEGAKVPWLPKPPAGQLMETITTPLYMARSSTTGIAAFIKEQDHNFYSAETITREIPVYNDSASEAKVILGMDLRAGRRVVESVKTHFTLAAGESARYRLSIKMPKVKTRKELVLTITAGRPEYQTLSSYSRNITVRPAPRTNPAGKARIQGYRLNPELRAALAKWKVKWAATGDLTKVTRSRCDILLIGPDSLSVFARRSETSDLRVPQLQALERFVESGGNAIVLDQSEYPASLFGLAIETADSPATVAFNAAPHHSIMRDFSAGDLRYWRGDDRVTRAPFLKPGEGTAIVLVESGTATGLDMAPLILARYGRGSALLCQLMVARKAGREPAADALLRFMLRFAAQPPKSLRPTAILAKSTSPAARRLDSLGLRAEVINGRLSLGPLGRFGRIFVDASDPETMDQMVSETGRLEGFVRDGGALVIHDLQPGDEQLITGLTGTIIEPSNSASSAYAWKSLPLSVLDGISNYDLFLSRWQEGRLAPIRPIVENGWRVRSGLGMNLLEPMGLLRIPYGKGQILIDSVRWEGDDDILTTKRSRYISALLRNLGTEFASK